MACSTSWEDGQQTTSITKHLDRWRVQAADCLTVSILSKRIVIHQEVQSQVRMHTRVEAVLFLHLSNLILLAGFCMQW